MAAAPAPEPTPPAPRPALVGRDRELVALRAALDAALAGRGALVLIGGEAGIGKTALAEVLLAEATERGATVLVGRCYDLAETPPYGPWAEALPPPALAGDGEGGGQVALFARVRDTLAARAARRPQVLLLEDLHWADPASLDLLRAVARGLADLPLLLLATYRADEVGGDHPLAALLPLLVREARAARLDLRPLDGAAIAALVAARYALGAADHIRLVGYLAGRTEGNALFLGELLRTLEGAGALRPVGEGWALGDLAGVPVPPLLRQVIAGRLGRLPHGAAGLLALAAVVGQVVPLALWAAVAGTDEDALLDAVERAAAAQLVIEEADGQAVRFAHALIREALYEGLPAGRRRRAHRAAGAALAATARPDPDAVADHFRRAGDARAAEWLVRAGERARAAYAWLTAAERYEAALALAEADGAAADRGLRVALLYRLARVRRFTSPQRGILALETVARLGREAGDDYLVACAVAEQGFLRMRAGEMRRGLDQMVEGTAALDALPAGRRTGVITLGGRPAAAPALYATLAGVRGEPSDPEHHMRGTLVLFLANVGRYAEAEALAARFGNAPPHPDLVRARGDDHADWAFGRAFAHAMLGRPEEARRWYAPVRELYRALGHHLLVGHAALDELDFAALPYRPEDIRGREALAAEGAAAYRLAIGVMAGVPSDLARLPLLVLEGHWAAARGAARAMPEPHGAVAPLAHAVLATLAREQGDHAEGWRLVREALPEGPRTLPGELLHVAALRFQRLAVLLALDGGDRATARAWLDAHDRWLAWSGVVLGQAEGQLGWAAYHRAGGDPGAAYEHARRAQAHASAPRQPLALLAAARLLGELAIDAGDSASARAYLDEALTLADACAAPYERALTLLALAELQQATGASVVAATSLAEARAILVPLGAAPALARAAALAARLPAPPTPTPAALPFGLTAREAEVLRLVAEGLTDPQIAARLFVGRSTVATHLRAIFGKLGVNTRAAATRIATAHDLT